MKILITGGAGFIGSNLADRLLSRGDTVIILDNFETGQRRNIPDGAEFHQLTLGDEAISPESDLLLALDWKNIDVVVHAAASYKDPDNWRRDSMTNVVGTADLLKAMQMREKRRLIYFQTALMYGLKPPPHPIPVTQPQSPIGSSYAVTKTAAENLIATSNLDYVSFRLANCYGPRNLSGPVPTFYRKLSAGETCTVMDTRRDFIFVSDLVDLVVKAIDGKGHGVYHVSSGKDVKIADVLYHVWETVRSETPITIKPRSADDVETILLDPSRTEWEFEWSAATSLESGIKQAVEYYKEFGVGETYTHLKMDKKEG